MGTTMNKSAFEKVIQENLDWLEDQPRSLEREHIKEILKECVQFYYPEKEYLQQQNERLREAIPIYEHIKSWAMRKGLVIPTEEYEKLEALKQ